jgi:hypothetical protein
VSFGGPNPKHQLSGLARTPLTEFSVHRPTRRPSGRLLRWLGIAPLLVVVVAGTGCGPFGYLKKVATDATRAVADAEAAGAEEYAPYEYWGAVAYLEQAKILMGYSEYERSFDFGERAKQLANEAKIKAQRVRKGESVQRDENIAAPDQMLDAEGNQIEKVDEVYEGDAKSGGDK